MEKRADALTPHWVVAHCGARDQYELPIAFHEVAQLDRFVTDWYSPLDRPTLDQLLKWVPQYLRSALAKRFRGELPSEAVQDLKPAAALTSVFGTHGLNHRLNRLVGECAAQVARDRGSDLLITSYYGWAAFPQLPKQTRKVLFQIHPHPWFLRNLYRTRASEDEPIEGFACESEMRAGEAFLRLWGQESLDADLVIATSSFTRQSLLYAGVRPERIRIIPYGVDGRMFRSDVAAPSGKTKVLFVGQATARKGFQRLVEAWKHIGNRATELHIVSGAAPQLREALVRGTVVWHERLALRDLIALKSRSDLLVLPSIAEGFGHVLLQSLSCGTPILCSDATAGPDLLMDWEKGFIFPSGNWAEFSARLDYWLTNVDRLRSLRVAAREIAERLPWDRFRSGVRNACNSVSDRNNGS